MGVSLLFLFIFLSDHNTFSLGKLNAHRVVWSSLCVNHPDWEILGSILIKTLISQWGYQYTPIGRHLYPDWNPNLPMRIPIGPNRESLGMDHGGWCQPYYPDWEILVSWLKPWSPNEDTIGPNWETFWRFHCYEINKIENTSVFLILIFRMLDNEFIINFITKFSNHWGECSTVQSLYPGLILSQISLFLHANSIPN